MLNNFKTVTDVQTDAQYCHFV